MSESNESVAEQLAAYGTVLTDPRNLPAAVFMDGRRETFRQIQAALSRSEGAKAVLLIGPSGAGKTAFVHALANHYYDASPDETHLVQLSLSRLIAGGAYIGVWEERFNGLVALAAKTSAVLFVPSLIDLSSAGRHSKSDYNMAAALAEPLAQGRIAMIAESTPEAYSTLLAREPALVRLFEVIQVPAATAAETRELLAWVATREGRTIGTPVLNRAVELASEFLVGSVLPGAAVDMLLRAIHGVSDPERVIDASDLLVTLSASTGLPRDYLDDTIPLDRASVRRFLEARVMGQPEAVDAVMERVALIKAGLTDPERPFGVLMFAGPTGVGKTELARALAELLFGDPNRMIRLDMSEFAKPDSYVRLLGTAWEPGVLTDPVRSQPFSLVLLDEIEKSSLNVFDLCLQLFDAGRLTDGKGVTADFRRTLIIVTTNVGAAVSRKGTVGFFESAGAAPDGGDAAHAERELSLAFRPEFLNRFDHIVRFRPLDELVIARIAERELRKVLERSGIRRREISLDVDPSLLSLLLREGYSPTFGARPLKRAVERKVLLPVAWALARGDAPLGSTMHLSAVSGQVRVSISPPEAQTTELEVFEPDTVQQRVDLRRVSARMLAEADVLIEAFAPMRSRLSARMIESGAPGFYSDSTRSRAVLEEIYRLDGARREVEEVRASIASFDDRVQRRVRDDRELAALDRQAQLLEARLDHVRFIVSCDDLDALGDAYVTITRLRSKDRSLDGVVRLAGMYRAFAERRGLSCDVVDDHTDPISGDDTVSLLISGCGAYALLHRESGLHKLREGASPRDVRETLRVDVHPLPPEVGSPSADAIGIEVRRTARPGRLIRSVTLEVRLLHRASKTSLRADCHGSRDWALERLMPLLLIRVAESTSAVKREEQVIRRYSLGPSQRVRDVRTGYATGRLDRVLRGDIDRFLVGPRVR